MEETDTRLERIARFDRIARATPDVLRKIDAILDGKCPLEGSESKPSDCKLITITQACRMLGINYYRFRRAMKRGCFDIVSATGRNLVTETSVRAFAHGQRNPTKAL